MLDGKVGTGRPSELAGWTAFILRVKAWRHSFTSCATLNDIRTVKLIGHLVRAELMRHLRGCAQLLSCLYAVVWCPTGRTREALKVRAVFTSFIQSDRLFLFIIRIILSVLLNSADFVF